MTHRFTLTPRYPGQFLMLDDGSYIGHVIWNRTRRTWHAYVHRNGAGVLVGDFDTKREAVEAAWSNREVASGT